MHDDFQTAYLYTLDKVYNNAQFYNEPRGNRSREILSYSVTIKNPIERVCYLPVRKINIVFNFAEAIWYMSGSNELSFIEYYASNMRKYSEDGKTLKGTAYGTKIFSFGESNINQWQRVIDVLKEDRDSKRAFIAIFDANEDLSLKNIDVSCTLGLQFFIRENKLHMCTFMRANDAYRGFSSDVFSFTFIQEFLAAQLNLEVGEYYHHVSSIHIYEPDYSKVDILLNQEGKEASYVKYKFPKMKKENNWNDLNVVIKYERLLRENIINLTKKEIENLEIDDYWKQVITLFSLYQKIYNKQMIDWEQYNFLYPIYQYFVRCKWNRLFEEEGF